MKEIRLTGRQLVRDIQNGIHKFSLTGNVGGSAVSGELEVDKSSPGAEVKLNYSPGTIREISFDSGVDLVMTQGWISDFPERGLRISTTGG